MAAPLKTNVPPVGGGAAPLSQGSGQQVSHTPGPNTIVFTQYLLPDGRPKTVWLEMRPEHIVAKAKQILDAGFRFECEMLRDRQTVSLTITDDEDDWAIAVVPNGPAVPQAVDRMVDKFDIAKFKALSEARGAQS